MAILPLSSPGSAPIMGQPVSQEEFGQGEYRFRHNGHDQQDQYPEHAGPHAPQDAFSPWAVRNSGPDGGPGPELAESILEITILALPQRRHVPLTRR